MKKITAIVGAVAMLATSVIPVFAAGTDCSNVTTGPLSTNYCNVTNNSNVTVSNINDAQITNNVTASTNTGGNNLSYGTLGGTITTGNATLNASVQTVANVNTTTISGGAAASGNTGGNAVTGPESDNRVTITNSNRVQVDNSNTASVVNNVNATSDTGSNIANYTTGPASIDTGDAVLGVTVATHTNDNLNDVRAGAGGTGGNIGSNSTTGPLSIDYVDIVNNTTALVSNINDMVVNNNINVLSNTGRNMASFGTIGADILTGNAVAGVGLNTEGNVNTTSVQMAMGGFLTDAGNGITGAISDNRIGEVNNQTVSVENFNNKCWSHNADRLGCSPADLGVFNTDNDVVDTGSNVANYNTGGGTLMTGLAELAKTVLTHMTDSYTVIQ